MTRIVALDTSTWWGSVALVEREAADEQPRVVGEIGLHMRHSHSAHVLKWIEILLAEAGWSRSGLDGYAASRGPGSFTGIRVGLGTLRGLETATDRPCVGVTSLEALAEAHGPAEAERMAVMDAGRGEMYAARFDARSSPPLEREPPTLAPAEELLDLLPRDGLVVIPGPGTRTELPSTPSRTVRVARTPGWLAGAVGRLGLPRCETPRRGRTPLAPLYLRPPDALFKRRK